MSQKFKKPENRLYKGHTTGDLKYPEAAFLVVCDPSMNEL